MLSTAYTGIIPARVQRNARKTMQFKFDPVDGLVLLFQPYEYDLARKVLILTRREMAKHEDNTDILDAILVAVINDKQRRQ